MNSNAPLFPKSPRFTRMPKVTSPLYLLPAALWYAITIQQGRRSAQELRSGDYRRGFARCVNVFLASMMGGVALKAATVDWDIEEFEDNDSAEGTLGDVNYILNCLDEMDTEAMNDETTFRIHGVTTTLEQIRADLLAQRGDMVVPDREAWDNETGQGLADAADGLITGPGPHAQRADMLMRGKINLFDLEDDELGRLTQAARAWAREVSRGGYAGSGDPTPMIREFLGTVDAEELTLIITGEPVDLAKYEQYRDDFIDLGDKKD